MTFRFHVVGLPHTSVTEAFTACAFTERVRKFCGMMHGLGHQVFLYAGPESTAAVTEHIPCITEAERAAAVGDGHFIHASFNYDLPHWRKFNERAIEAIRARAERHDFLCLIGGIAHKQIADAVDLMTVEFSIGYGGTFARFRIWESRAWQHTCYGTLQEDRNPNAIDGRFYDAVIPGSFDPADFPFRAEKDDYHLFMGRLTQRKGIEIAVEACQRLGKRLIIAGQGDPPAYGEYVGVVGPEERGRLMAGAQAVWVPTIYIEPFGNVAVEAQLCGTPVICTPWGAMTETVEDGVTGFHCHLLREFMAAAEDARGLDRHAIRDRAVRLYSTDAVAQKYQKHFERLATVWGNGWYTV
ncbi:MULTISPECIES: glycosyltransferase [Rhodomicrobium]|uniref:glycosyltransferase n=1 Tax=Rhodomicrobium TaxID=1068 RepID=UPI000B4B8928|nr:MULTISPECIES: glycosyltransferase [Rhodomicrobium]